MKISISSNVRTFSNILSARWQVIQFNIIQLHTIRFWETQFKQLKPKKVNNRRYYDSKNIDLLLKIQ